MPVYQELVNHNKMIAQLKEPPIFINDLDNMSEKSKEDIKNLIMTRYTTTDMISILPSCQCGELKGEFVIGDTCNACGTVVRSSVTEDIEPILWFKTPVGVRKLINPTVWNQLKARFCKSGFNVIQWLCDTTYRPNVKQPKFLDQLSQIFISMNIDRGYNSFVDNFDAIMEVLFSQKNFRLPGTKAKRVKIDYLKHLLQDYRDCVFSDYIPLPNRCLIIVEKTNTGVYIDPIIINAINAIEMLVGVDSEAINHTQKVRENRTVKAIAQLAEYYTDFSADKLSGKTGIFRKHVFGARSHFSFRAVIISLTGPHRYDEIEVPWVIGLTAFREHLLNKLLKMGFDLNSAIGFLNGHVDTYNSVLDRLLTELIQEAPNQRIPCIVQRNPSMLNGSAQLMGIRKFKTDPKDLTLSYPILSVVPPNCDFDGDELNITIALDNYIAGLWYGLSPHKNVFVLSEPRSISGNIAIPKPVVTTISNFISSKKDYHFSEQQIANFAAIPEI